MEKVDDALGRMVFDLALPSPMSVEGAWDKMDERKRAPWIEAATAACRVGIKMVQYTKDRVVDRADAMKFDLSRARDYFEKELRERQQTIDKLVDELQETRRERDEWRSLAEVVRGGR